MKTVEYRTNWKRVVDAPGYWVSRWGEVFTMTRERTLKQSTTKKGYKVTTVNGKTVRVHRLVAAAFIGPCPDGFQVRHLDGDPKNNRVENLAYGTAKQNSQDMIDHGRSCRGSKNPSAKLTKAQTRAIFEDPRPQREIAAEYGINQSNVSRIKNGKTWTT